MNFQLYDSDVDWVIIGVLFDMVIFGCVGGCYGLAVICQVLMNLVWEYNCFLWNFDMCECLNVVDCGDLVYVFGDVCEMSEKLQVYVEKLLAVGKCMFFFGGDYFVMLLLLCVYVKYFGKMVLVYFDVYIDIYVNGCEFDYGIMFYIALKEGLIDLNYFVQIGICIEFDKDNGFIVLDVCQVNDCSVDDVIV